MRSPFDHVPLGVDPGSPLSFLMVTPCSGVTGSKSGQVRFQDFWAINWLELRKKSIYLGDSFLDSTPLLTVWKK